MHTHSRSLIRIIKINLDNNFKFSPPCFSNLIWWFKNYPIWFRIAIMKFKVNFLDIRGHVFIVKRFNINSPLVCVAIFFPFLAEIPSDISINNRFRYCHSLQENTKIINFLSGGKYKYIGSQTHFDSNSRFWT